jgi:uncharacterized protein
MHELEVCKDANVFQLPDVVCRVPPFRECHMSAIPPVPPSSLGLAALASPRRSDRGQDDGWTRTFLEQALFGVLATVHEGRPFLNSNIFAYDPEGHRIYLHTARTGRTPGNAAEGGAATFTAAVMGRMLPAETALEFSVEYAAVVVFGTIRTADDEAEKRHGLELIMRKYAPHLEPGRDYRAITGAELTRTAVHSLEIEAWSGKQKVVAPDFPGAYTMRGPLPQVERG